MEFYKHFKTCGQHTYPVASTVYGVLEGDTLKVSMAITSSKDRFERKVGRDVARARMDVSPCMVVRYNPKFHGKHKGKFFTSVAEMAYKTFHNRGDLLQNCR